MRIYLIDKDKTARSKAHASVDKAVPGAEISEFPDPAAVVAALSPKMGAKAGERLEVQCFGYFDVFYRDEPLIFARAKTKELLAYLIDREGAACTAGEIELALWENAAALRDTKQYLRVLTNELRTVLASVGLEDILIRSHNQWAVRRKMLNCDYYRLLDGDEKAAQSFDGEYMKQYSWAEETAARLQFRMDTL